MGGHYGLPFTYRLFTKDLVIQIFFGMHLLFLIWSPVLFKKGLRSFQPLVHVIQAIELRQLDILTKQILEGYLHLMKSGLPLNLCSFLVF